MFVNGRVMSLPHVGYETRKAPIWEPHGTLIYPGTIYFNPHLTHLFSIWRVRIFRPQWTNTPPIWAVKTQQVPRCHLHGKCQPTMPHMRQVITTWVPYSLVWRVGVGYYRGKGDSCSHGAKLQGYAAGRGKIHKLENVAIIAMYCHLRPPDAIA